MGRSLSGLYEIDTLRVVNCQGCRLFAGRTQIVNGSGFAHAAVMFTGEAPGKAEDRTGVGFQGKAGKIFDAILGYLGLTREMIWLNNAVRCRPVHGSKNRTPKRDEVDACRIWLQRDIDVMAPRIIVTLGRIPYESLTGRQDFTHMRGKPVEVGALPTVFPLFHPAYLIYRQAARRVMCEDLAALARYFDDRRIDHAPPENAFCQS